VASGATAAHALDAAALRIAKEVNVRGDIYDEPAAPVVSVGEEFVWNIEVICDYFTDQCVGATLTDVIPDEFEILEDSINSTPSGIITVDGQTVTIAFQETLTRPAGAIGLSAGAQITIPVKLRAIEQSRDGEKFTNRAAVEADNALETTDIASVTAQVDLTLLAEASKSFDPSSALAEEGAPLSLTFGGSNASNGAVDTLVVQDPANPAANPNIFQQYLQLDALTSATWPEGAEAAVVSVFDMTTSTWVSADSVAAPSALALPAGVDAQNIGGIRVEFTAANPTIPAGATTSVQLALSQRASAAGITADTLLANTSTAQVKAGAEESPIAPANDDVTLRPASTEVTASKNITPHEIAVVGAATEATVTLGALNSGTRALDTLTISEPTNPADLSANNLMAPAFTGGGVTFAGFAGVEWPVGTEEVSVTYYFADGTTETVTGTELDALPAPTSTARITGFEITFTGEIVEGAEAKVPFTVQAPEDLGDPSVRSVSGLNEITVSGTTPGSAPNPDPDTADDDLTIFAEQITITTEKTLTNTQLLSVPGQTTTARLKTTIANYPQTTENATEVIIDDPASLTGVTDWYEHFNATAITLTQIPANATLTVQWRDAAGNFTDVPGMVDIAGGTVFSGAIDPAIIDQVAGIRFIYKSDDGFVPGQELLPNITYTTRSTIRTTNAAIPRMHADSTTPLTEPLFSDLENCSASEASSSDLESGRVEVPAPCPTLDLMPVGPGVGPNIDKNWTPDLVFTRSGQNTTASLAWTAGIQGLDQVIISDVKTHAITGVPLEVGPDSVFDTFNLTRIGPINDPLMAFDQVQVQVYNSVDNEWQDLATCTAAAPCSGGTISAINLSAAQQESTVAVRFIVTEKDDRTPTQITDPLPGTGVAVGSRNFPLTLQIRDVRRSAPT
ncbi:MAG: hypothetical protein GX862_04295, partial [Leucobacter sp.]|nr:hypothetical protein [Leucobacter sp.]